MTTSFATRFDALNQWKRAFELPLASFGAFLDEHELSGASSRGLLGALRQRCGNDKLVLAFVAERSLNPSELINAIFFADTGRRVLPSMTRQVALCPVELGYDAGQPPTLALLPVESLREGATVAQLRADLRAWTIVSLADSSQSQLAESLAEVSRTKWVSQSEARALGYWDETCPQDNPTHDTDRRVEIPAWRYAMVNYSHPLLDRGLVVLNVPGLNMLGTEPELARNLLSNADAVVFLVAADSGVTESDLATWRKHLAASTLSRMVVIDEIHTLRARLLAPEQVNCQVERLRQTTAQVLDLPVDDVFALSAREALIARVEGDALALQHSGVLELEDVLGEQLLLQQRDLVAAVIRDGAKQLHALAATRLGERRAHIAEQILELRELQGQSGAKVRAMLHSVDMDTAKFERCSSRLQALRMVHNRMITVALLRLTRDRLREEIVRTQQEVGASLLYLGARKSLVAMCERLREGLHTAQMRAKEIHAMLEGSFAQFNADFGFGLVLPQEPELTRYIDDLGLIEHDHVQRLGLTQALRLAQPKFRSEFYRMIVSKVRNVFEAARSDLELWSEGALEQVDSQLRERRRSFRRRREALERVESVTSELSQRIGEIEAQDVQLQHLLSCVRDFAGELIFRVGHYHDDQETQGRSVVAGHMHTDVFEMDQAKCEFAPA